MSSKFFSQKWSIYIGGAITAFLFIFMLYILDTPVGMSQAYIMLSDYCRETVYNKSIKEPPFLDWQTGFLAGIFLGALIAAILSGEWRLELVPGGKIKKFFSSIFSSILLGMLGGFFVMLGLQLSGDSFIGQWAGAIQYSTSAWFFFLSIFFWSIVITFFLGGKYTGKKTKPKTADEGSGSKESA
jgi:hypothetical protein